MWVVTLGLIIGVIYWVSKPRQPQNESVARRRKRMLREQQEREAKAAGAGTTFSVNNDDVELLKTAAKMYVGYRVGKAIFDPKKLMN